MGRKHDFAWMAGFIDADGCVRVSKKLNKRVRHEKFVYEVDVNATNCNMESLEKCKQIAGGGSIFMCEAPKKATHRQRFRWQATGPICKDLLKHLIPYMTVKRAQAILCREAQTLMTRGKANPNHERLEVLRLEVKRLKHV